MKIKRRVFCAFLCLLLLASAWSFPTSATEANGDVELVAGGAVRWIDRVVLPDGFVALYDKLSEGVDNDGVEDILIEDETLNDEEFTIEVLSESQTLNGRTLAEVRDEVHNRATPYLYAVFAAFDRDHPEVFWLTDAWQVGSTARSLGEDCTVTVYLSLQNIRSDAYADEAAIRTAIAERDRAIETITADFTEQTTNYEKLRHFNRVLTEQNQYNTSADLYALDAACRESILALIGGVGEQGPVCESYARAFAVLCAAEGIPCVLVDGMATNSTGASEPHMWNYVQLQGAWYAVDVTWNDPSGGEDAAVSGVENEDWLLVGGNTVIDGMTFLASHPVSNLVYDGMTAFVNGPTLSDSAWESAFELALQLPASGYIYDGNEKKPSVTVKHEGVVLIENVDYTLDYADCIDAGEATVTVRGLGAYDGEASEIYPIAQKPISAVVTVQDKVYDGTTAAQVSFSLPDGALAERDRERGISIEGSAVFADANAGESVAVAVLMRLLGEGSENYALDLLPDASATIERRVVTVCADAKIVPVGASTVSLTYTVDPLTPLAQGDSLRGSLTLGGRRSDGSYPIEQGTLNDENNPNYRITFISATVTQEASTPTPPATEGGSTPPATGDGSTSAPSVETGKTEPNAPNEIGKTPSDKSELSGGLLSDAPIGQMPISVIVAIGALALVAVIVIVIVATRKGR